MTGCRLPGENQGKKKRGIGALGDIVGRGGWREGKRIKRLVRGGKEQRRSPLL